MTQNFVIRKFSPPKKSSLLNNKGKLELPPHRHESNNNNLLHHTLLPVKPHNTYSYDKINQPKASNSATDGDIFILIKSKTESLDAFIDSLIDSHINTSRMGINGRKRKNDCANTDLLLNKTDNLL